MIPPAVVVHPIYSLLNGIASLLKHLFSCVIIGCTSVYLASVSLVNFKRSKILKSAAVNSTV